MFNQNQDEGKSPESTDNFEMQKISPVIIDYLEMRSYYNEAIFIHRNDWTKCLGGFDACKQAAGYVRMRHWCWEEFWYLCLRERSQSRSQSLLPFQTDVRLDLGARYSRRKMRSERSGIISILY